MAEKVLNLVEECQPTEANFTVGVLALQGAFLEHLNVLRRLGVEAHPIRKPDELADLAGLIIPGGESTTMGKLAVRWGLIEPLKALIAAGKPVWGTCAGLIMLAQDIGGGQVGPPRLAVMDMTVDRNAYGRQVDSFEAALSLDWFGDIFSQEHRHPFPAVFIRAPLIKAVGPTVTPLIYHQGHVVAAIQDNQIFVTSFHPELTGDSRLHAYFLSLINKKNEKVGSIK